MCSCKFRFQVWWVKQSKKLCFAVWLIRMWLFFQLHFSDAASRACSPPERCNRIAGNFHLIRSEGIWSRNNWIQGNSIKHNQISTVRFLAAPGIWHIIHFKKKRKKKKKNPWFLYRVNVWTSQNTVDRKSF